MKKFNPTTYVPRFQFYSDYDDPCCDKMNEKGQVVETQIHSWLWNSNDGSILFVKNEDYEIALKEINRLNEEIKKLKGE